MRNTTIVEVDAWEALDSRGQPTVCARVVLAGGAAARALAPAGASTGRHEARERRDGDRSRYAGRGVRTAVAAVRGEIAEGLRGVDAADQRAVDDRLVGLDGTADLGRLGANALLPTSVAVARAAAWMSGRPLYAALGSSPLLPMPMINIISGGAHADHLIDLQDLLVVPLGAVSFAQALEWADAVRRSTATVLDDAGLGSALVADEGGLAARLPSNRAAFDMLLRGMERSGLRPGVDVAIAVDIAASQFAVGEGQYRFAVEDHVMSSADLVGVIAGWCAEYPIVSVEDPLGEDDWPAWAALSARLPGIQILGDDLFVTDRDRLAQGIARSVANAVLVKPNQCGTVTAAADVVEMAQRSGYRTVVSARSGDTEENWLADLAVGWRAGQIKVGSTTRSERLAKWNRLLELEHRLGDAAQFAGWLPALN